MEVNVTPSPQRPSKRKKNLISGGIDDDETPRVRCADGAHSGGLRVHSHEGHATDERRRSEGIPAGGWGGGGAGACTFTGQCMCGGDASTQGNAFLIPTPTLPPCTSAVCGVAPVPKPPIP